MSIPFVIDNQQHRMADALNELLTQCVGKPLEIARTERSALAPEAQPYQDLIDRILFRLAGLNDDEARGLEKRLRAML
jgi:hypothetical protein